jgi:hypothetical protein
MAARLVRRGSFTLTGLDDLASSAAAYVLDGAWLDLARTVVSRGDADPTFASLCAELAAEGDAARLAEGLPFARIAVRAADPLPRTAVRPALFEETSTAAEDRAAGPLDGATATS